MNIVEIIELLKNHTLCLTVGIITLILLFFLVPSEAGTILDQLKTPVKYCAYFLTGWGLIGYLRRI